MENKFLDESMMQEHKKPSLHVSGQEENLFSLHCHSHQTQVLKVDYWQVGCLYMSHI